MAWSFPAAVEIKPAGGKRRLASRANVGHRDFISARRWLAAGNGGQRGRGRCGRKSTIPVAQQDRHRVVTAVGNGEVRNAVAV
jgi:hypothetical protein